MALDGARPIPPGDGGSPKPRRAISTGPPRMTPLREMQLLEAHRAGDGEALGELLDAYQHRIYAVCYRMLRDVDEASDLTQDSLIKVIEGLDSYDGRSKLSTWMIRIAMNCCLSHLRKQKLRRHGSLDAAGAALEGGAAFGTHWGRSLQGELSGSRRVEQAEARGILHRALMSLEPDARAVLVLRDMQDLDYEQIAEVLETPLGTVKSRLFRARAALRAMIEQISPTPPGHH
ncbi:MAG TPA: sigma-70 family RNA polymerase sigma factor [Phycisphaerales bacterium]|nr:sigma-70 family RNA polymerase sigma factor [Phycisphaerales bacterium]HRQ74852.1 sigma-70 family RNA polymerase sigma factor [Phycisphaerales bacterium]